MPAGSYWGGVRRASNLSVEAGTDRATPESFCYTLYVLSPSLLLLCQFHLNKGKHTYHNRRHICSGRGHPIIEGGKACVMQVLHDSQRLIGGAVLVIRLDTVKSCNIPLMDRMMEKVSTGRTPGMVIAKNCRIREAPSIEAALLLNSSRKTMEQHANVQKVRQDKSKYCLNRQLNNQYSQGIKDGLAKGLVRLQKLKIFPR